MMERGNEGTRARRHDCTKGRWDEGTMGRKHEGTTARLHDGAMGRLHGGAMFLVWNDFRYTVDNLLRCLLFPPCKACARNDLHGERGVVGFIVF